MKTIARLLILAVALFGLTGCVQTKLKTPNGVEFSRTSFLNRQSIGKVKFDPVTGKLEMEGYSNQQTEALAAVAGAVAAAK